VDAKRVDEELVDGECVDGEGVDGEGVGSRLSPLGCTNAVCCLVVQSVNSN